jgi:hypothetical protein
MLQDGHGSGYCRNIARILLCNTDKKLTECTILFWLLPKRKRLPCREESSSIRITVQDDYFELRNFEVINTKHL